MDLPEPCGPVSRQVAEALRTENRERCHVVLPEEPVLTDRDVQLGLWMLYELSYRGFDDVDPAAEWEPAVVGIRRGGGGAGGAARAPGAPPPPAAAAPRRGRGRPAP